MRTPFIALGLAMLAAGCASSDVKEAALSACEAQHGAEAQMPACRERMENTIRTARNLSRRQTTTPLPEIH